MRRGRRNGNRRRPGGRPRYAPGVKRGRNPVTPLNPRITDGVFRLRDTLTLSSSEGGNLAQLISRSYTQFSEEKSLSAMYTQVRLISFELSVTPARIYAKGDSDEKNLSMGWFVFGTTPVTTVTAASSGNQVLAQSDSREVFMRNRIVPWHFRSVCPRFGYMPTAFASETSYPFAGSPGSIYVNNMLSGSEAASVDLMYVIITGIYQFSGRTT